MGIGNLKFLQIKTSHVPEYQVNLKVRRTARDWQASRQQRMKHLALHDISFSTLQGIEVQFTWAKEIELRTQEQETEEKFFQATDNFARKNHAVALLSKSRLINSLTAIILGLWLIVLVGSILAINTATGAGKRDLTEVPLEAGEKLCAFAAVTAKTYMWRIATFGLVAVFSIVKKGVQVYVDPAPDRIAGPNWAFALGLVAKAFEHIAYAIRLTPASRAWDLIYAQSARESKHLSAEQWARRSLWAAKYYQEYLLTKQKLRTASEQQSGPRMYSY